ncbi:MAG TPA: FAD-dependent monooxygenase [Solirubrobacteraceae bacterium]|nr:FAD-dependent monooxygenase [Solirubrobacteraceae bacterium]
MSETRSRARLNIQTTDVLVVGAGPAGLTLSALLARSGTSAVTITRHRATAHTPRAHITNQRTMEILRDLGVEADAHVAGHPFDDTLPNIVWATAFAGLEIARVRARGAGPDRLSDYALGSPCKTWNISQNRLEPLVLLAAQRFGADIRFGVELTDLVDHGDYVEATIRDRESDTLDTVRARWLVGADGGASTVAELGGFQIEGSHNVRRAVNIWAEVDLTEFCAHRPANIYAIHQPGRDAWMGAGLWVCASPWNEWVVSRFVDGTEAPPEITEAQAVSWLREGIGRDLPVEVRDISHWAIHDAVATEYQRGNILLVGDAAHRHPPVNGLGTNTSVQDSYNLGWKLAMVAAGHADESLLGSYQAERRPVGQQVVRRSWTSARNSAALGEAIGLRPDHSRVSGFESLSELAAPGPAGTRRRDALRQALANTRFQFNAQGIELGQRYASAAVVAETGTAGAEEALAEPARMDHPVPAGRRRDPELYYDPDTEPGCCLPHAWVEYDGQLISTLDIPRHVGFTLLTGVDGDVWTAAAGRAASAYALPLSVAAVGYHLEFDDVYGDWADIRRISDDGCLLVRPDRFIAWRCLSAPADAFAELDAVLGQILGAAPAVAGAA